MKNFEKLIQEFCPNGVPFKKVKNVYTRLKGTPITAGKMKEIACGGGEIRVFAGGKTIIDAHEKDIPKANITRTPAVIVQSRGVIDVVYYDKPFTFKNEMWAYTADDSVSVKYLYYVLKNNIQSFRDTASRMGSLPQISLSVTEEFMLPIPPLAVQREIVRMLDSFTLLTVELTSELTARKKQYEFYRDKLLSFDIGTRFERLGDTCNMKAGKAILSARISEKSSNITPYKCFGGNGVRGYVSDVSHHGEFPIIGRQGALCGNVNYATGDFYATEHAVVVESKGAYLQRFLYHLLTAMNLNQYKSQGAQPGLAVKNLENLIAPVPPLDVQERLVRVLDNFESICTDLNIALPAEIRARQKQYEYYRDLLLTFAETGSTLVTDRQTDRQIELNTIRLIQYVFGYVTLPMGSLFDFRNGLSKGKDFFGTGIPFIRYTDVYNNRFLRENDITALVECTPAEVEKLKVHRGDVFFTRTSETAEDVGWSSVMLDDIEDCVFNGFTIKATAKTDFLLPEYCAFCFATDDFRQYVTSHCAFTTRASLTGKTIAGYKLAFPSIEKQQEIVNVLSKFHALCNDLSAGLPAEIEARRKQYEYYRDKLLSFEELQKK